VSCSGRIVLKCKKCKEHLILLGLEEDWRSEPGAFECECGEELTLADRGNEEVNDLRDLLRGLRGRPDDN